jgi:hypothetical protein
VFSKHSAENEGEKPTDPYTGIDLDHCRTPETGAIAPWAQQIITFLNTYSEVSPSGTGVKIFVQATLPRAGVNKHCIEIYDRGRFFTVTGWHVPGTPDTIEPRQSRIEALYAVHDLLDKGLQRHGERLSLLFAGRWEQIQPAPGLSTYRSQSEADLAFCALLARGGATAEQIDTLMRLSGLYRPKWDEKHGSQTYGVMTLAKAMGRGDRVHQLVHPFQNTTQQQHNEQRQPPTATVRSLPWESPVPFHEFTLPAFPINVLPEPLQRYVVALAQATQTPFDLAGMLVLAVCACALAKKVMVCIRPGYVEPVNLFVTVILPPGNRKSTVFAEVTAPIQAFEEAETQRMEALIAAAESQYRIAEKALQQGEMRAAKAESVAERRQLQEEAKAMALELADLHVPAQPRLLTEDTTPERLATLLSLHGGRMAVMSPEGGEVFDQMGGRYATSRLPNFGVYLKGHTGDTLRVDRVNRPAEYVKQPAVTVALTMQPDVLAGLMDTPGFRGRGLLGRFLYAMPSSLLGRRRPEAPRVPEPVLHAYYHAVMQLLKLPFGTDSTGQQVAHTLRLAPEARDMFQQFEAWLEPQLGPFGELGSMTDWAGKLVGAVARLAGLLHIADHANVAAPWQMAIGIGSVERAIRLGEYLIPHARATYAEMGADPVIADATHLLTWITREAKTHFTKRDAFEGTKGRFRRVEAMEPALRLLMEHGYIRQREPENRAGPGRKPSPTYDVNPFSAHNAPNSQNATFLPYSANSANSAYRESSQKNEPTVTGPHAHSE